jgi:hypothetical protein
MSEEQAPQSFHAIVDLLGHRRLAGRVTEHVIAGAGFLRVDIPREDGSTVTKFVSPKSVYELSPCTEEIAQACAYRIYGVEPVKPADWQRQLPQGDFDDEPDSAEVPY